MPVSGCCFEDGKALRYPTKILEGEEMTIFLSGFLTGVFVGCFLGFLIIGLLLMAGKGGGRHGIF